MRTAAVGTEDLYDREMSPKLIKIIQGAEKEKEDKSKRKSFDSAREAIAFLKTV
jgi:hypothetical protein